MVKSPNGLETMGFSVFFRKWHAVGVQQLWHPDWGANGGEASRTHGIEPYGAHHHGLMLFLPLRGRSP